MGRHAFFSRLGTMSFEAQPYHYCALISNCDDDYEGVTARYRQLSGLSPEEIVREHAKAFGARFPDDYHITNENELLRLMQDYSILADLTPKLWDEVMRRDWQELLLPTIEAKGAEICSKLRDYPVRRFIEGYTRLNVQTDIGVHPSWAQFGAMPFHERDEPAISITIHEEELIWLLSFLTHESLHILWDQEGMFEDETTLALEKLITERLKTRGVEVGPHYELGLNCIQEALTQAITSRILNLEVDPTFNIEKIPILQSTMYRALMDIHEGKDRTLTETLPEILRWCASQLQ